jgi:hypothetical protein
MNGEPRDVAHFGVVHAKRIEIVADDGSTRIELGTSDRGDAVFRLRDRAATVRVVVSIQDDAPRVRLLDRSGAVRFSAILREDQPGLELLGSDGKPRLVMFLRGHEDEAPDLYFADREGEPRFGVAMDRGGEISVAIKDEAGSLHDVIWTATISEDIEDEPLK